MGVRLLFSSAVSLISVIPHKEQVPIRGLGFRVGVHVLQIVETQISLLSVISPCLGPRMVSVVGASCPKGPVHNNHTNSDDYIGKCYSGFVEYICLGRRGSGLRV